MPSRAASLISTLNVCKIPPIVYDFIESALRSKIMHNRKSSAEQVYTTLRDLILRGKLRAGQSLRSAELKAEYGFGLTPLREALNRLQVERLVVSVFNQGFRVADVTLEEIADLGRTRSMLESEMLSESIRCGGEDWENTIVAAHYQLSKMDPPSQDADDQYMTAWEQRHDAFHDALVSACTSPWLNHLAHGISAQYQRCHRNVLLDMAEIAQSHSRATEPIRSKLAQVMGLKAHTVLMDAALARDLARADELLNQHVLLTSEVYLSFQKLILDSQKLPASTGK